MGDRADEPITADWLKEVGFKWHELDRQSDKHWLLWLGSAIRAQDDSLTSYEDLGIEVAPGWYRNRAGETAGRTDWFCWLRSDAAHRYHRFIHIRHLRTRGDLVRLVEAITGFEWDPQNHRYGSALSPAEAERQRREDDRMDRRLRRDGAPWSSIEKDDTQGGALPEHLEAHTEARRKETPSR